MKSKAIVQQKKTLVMGPTPRLIGRLTIGHNINPAHKDSLGFFFMIRDLFFLNDGFFFLSQKELQQYI
jgi:hypothetical protein